jgi:hypothetical protein
MTPTASLRVKLVVPGEETVVALAGALVRVYLSVESGRGLRITARSWERRRTPRR